MIFLVVRVHYALKRVSCSINNYLKGAFAQVIVALKYQNYVNDLQLV